MNAFQGRAGLLLAVATLLSSSRATAQDLLPPALLPPASLSGPIAGRPLPIPRFDQTAEPLALSKLDEPASTIDFLPPPGDHDQTLLRVHPSLQGAYETAMKSSSESTLFAGPSFVSQPPQFADACCPCPCWFGSAGGLIMTRDQGGPFVTSIDTGTGAAVLGSGDVHPPGAGGVDLTLGKWFGSGSWGIGVNYWGVYPATQCADAFGSETLGALSSPFDFSGLDYDSGITSSTINDWFGDAVHHEVHQRNEYHSLEINFLGNRGFAPWEAAAYGSPVGYGWSLGMRYFRFNDDFAFLSDDFDTTFGGDADEVSYDVRTQNDLLGFQLGAGVSYRIWRNLSLHGIAKAGIYGVHARQEQFIGGAGGLAVINTGAFAGQAYDARAAETDVGMLAQLDLGGNWQVTPRWSLQMDYRLLGLTRVALVNDQIPSNFADRSQVVGVNTNGSLFLHGAYVGMTYSF